MKSKDLAAFAFLLVQLGMHTGKIRAISSAPKVQNEVSYYPLTMPTRWSEIFNNSYKFSQKERSFQKQLFSLVCHIPQMLNFPSYQLLMNDQKSYLQLP